MRAASIANQLKGFNKTVGNIWNVIDKSRQVEVKINYNNLQNDVKKLSLTIKNL